MQAGSMGLNFVQERKVRPFMLDDESLCMTRIDNKLYAFTQRCPHGGGPLHQGRLNEEGDIVCPWHRFTFCVKTGKNTSGDGYYMEVYPVEVRENGVWLGKRRRRKFLGIF